MTINTAALDAAVRRFHALRRIAREQGTYGPVLRAEILSRWSLLIAEYHHIRLREMRGG